MFNTSTASLVEMDAAVWRPSFEVGDVVRVKAGVEDPDFPGLRLDDWVGEIIDVGRRPDLPHFLVQWSDETVRRLAPFYRDRCETEDVVLDEMWLIADDLLRLTP